MMVTTVSAVKLRTRLTHQHPPDWGGGGVISSSRSTPESLFLSDLRFLFKPFTYRLVRVVYLLAEFVGCPQSIHVQLEGFLVELLTHFLLLL